MNNEVKRWIYILSSFLLIGFVAFLAINLLIWSLPIIAIIFIFLWLKKYFKFDSSKTKKKNQHMYSTVKPSSAEKNYSESEIIDVDYEDADK